MKKRLRYLGMLLTFAAISYFLLEVFEHGKVLLELHWNLPLFLALGVGIIFQGLIVFNGGIAWFLLLRGVKEPVGPLQATTLFATTQIGKYLPGNFGHHLGRAALSKYHGLEISRVVFTMGLESLWVLFAAAFAALIPLLAEGTILRSSFPQLPPVWLISALLVTIVFFLAICAKVLSHWRSKSLKHNGMAFPFPSASVMLVCFGLYLVNFFLLGIIITLLAKIAFGVSGQHIFLLFGIIAVAWIAGYIIPGAPAGFGVREAVLISALSPLWGNPTAVGISLFLRFVTTAGDGFAFVVGIVLRKRGAFYNA